MRKVRKFPDMSADVLWDSSLTQAADLAQDLFSPQIHFSGTDNITACVCLAQPCFTACCDSVQLGPHPASISSEAYIGAASGQGVLQCIA